MKYPEVARRIVHKARDWRAFYGNALLNAVYALSMAATARKRKQEGFRIAIQLPQLMFNTAGSVNGDIILAMALARGLEHRPEVDRAEVVGPDKACTGQYDLVLSLYARPYLKPVIGSVNYLWFQATLYGAPRSVLGGYNRIFCASPTLRDSFGLEKAEVMPMCASLELHHPTAPDPGLAHDVVFCGNNNRSPEVNARYLTPATRFDLAIYGERWDGFERWCRGVLPWERVSTLYSSAKIVLAYHTDWHREYNVLTTRIWEALACGAFVISDDLPMARDILGDTVVWTEGGEDLADKIEYYLEHEQERGAIAARGHELVRKSENANARAAQVVRALKEDMA